MSSLFVKFTLVNKEDDFLGNSWVHYAQIIGMCTLKDAKCTVAIFKDDHKEYVRETPQEILNQIDRIRKEL